MKFSKLREGWPGSYNIICSECGKRAGDHNIHKDDSLICFRTNVESHIVYFNWDGTNSTEDSYSLSSLPNKNPNTIFKVRKYHE